MMKYLYVKDTIIVFTVNRSRKSEKLFAKNFRTLNQLDCREYNSVMAELDNLNKENVFHILI